MKLVWKQIALIMTAGFYICFILSTQYFVLTSESFVTIIPIQKVNFTNNYFYTCIANVIFNSFQYTATNISINVSIEEPILSPGTLKLLSIKRHLEKAKKVTPLKPKFPNAQDKVDSKYYKILNIVKTKPGRANGINPLKFPPK